jgi:signal peptidase I
MGDNRDHSLDSRYLNHVGFVPEENIVGKAQLIVFSCNSQWFEIWKWFSNLRYDRFFTLLR